MRVKAFNIAKNPKSDGYQRGIASMVYKFFHKKASGKGNKNEIMSDQQLSEEIYKPIIRKLRKKVQLPFINNIWGADLPDMQLISKFNKVNIYRKYPLVISLKEKKGATITNAFQKSLKESNRKPHNIWVDIGSDFIIKQ